MKMRIKCCRGMNGLLKFNYSEKATKLSEIFTLLLTVCAVVKSKVKISQNFVAFSEFMNFNLYDYHGIQQKRHYAYKYDTQCIGLKLYCYHI